MTSMLMVLALLGVTEESKPEPIKLVVMPLRGSAMEASSMAVLDELLANAVRRAGNYEVISQSDIDAMLGLENLKDQLGCDDVTCAAEMRSAPWVLNS